MLKKQFPIHYFHAHGVALGGHLTKPLPEIMESQAATAISPVGGLASASATGFSHRGIVQFERATTQIVCTSTGDSYDTTVTCRIEGINILNQFMADEIVAHLSVTTPKIPKRGEPPVRFTTVGSRFVNLRVGGVLVTPVLDQECPRRPSGPYGGDKDHSVYDISSSETESKPLKNLKTLVSSVGVADSCQLSKGNAIHVPSFGVVYLAEYLVTPNARQLNMFRIELGCATEGRIAGSAVGGNGVVCDPPPPTP